MPQPQDPPRNTAQNSVVSALLVACSNRLGCDPRNTNYAGGNTSAKGTGARPGHRCRTSSCCGSRAPAATWAR